MGVSPSETEISHAGSVAVARFHHSLGDGMVKKKNGLLSLLLVCTRKTCDLYFRSPKEKQCEAPLLGITLVTWLGSY